MTRTETTEQETAAATDQFQPAVNHRAGYGAADERVERALYWARKGGTLMAGEGAILAMEIDRLRAEVAHLDAFRERVATLERRT